MKLDLTNNIMRDVALPIGPVRVFTGNALPLTLAGIPRNRDGLSVSAVTIYVTNADGVQLTASAVRIGPLWYAKFAASGFAHYGEIANGIAIDLTLADSSGATVTERIGVGQLIVVAASASASAGTPSAFCVVKGDRTFMRSKVVSSVQHYVEMTMEYDAEMGAWGANWTGDYILNAAGEFVSAT